MDRGWHWLERQQNVSKNVMPRQVVPNTDKSCQEDFSEGFFLSDLRKVVKINKKAMLKHIG